MDLSAVEQAKQRARERALHGKPTRAGKYPSKSSIRSSSGPSNGKHVDHELRDIREAFQATAMVMLKKLLLQIYIYIYLFV